MAFHLIQVNQVGFVQSMCQSCGGPACTKPDLIDVLVPTASTHTRIIMCAGSGRRPESGSEDV